MDSTNELGRPFNRRRFLSGCALCGVGALFDATSFAEQLKGREIEGCLLMPGDIAALGLASKDFGALPDASKLTDSTGDAKLDQALGRALARIAKTFDVRPSFAFFADDSAPNAYASPESTLPGTWGTVVFGRRLFTEQFRRYQDEGVSVLAIVAHEFGHVAQYSHKLIDDLRQSESTVRRIELHADYLSGWYLGSRKRQTPSISLWASGDTFRRIGDYNFNNPQHHGTPEQRVAASEGGFDLGYRKKVSSIEDAIEEGRRFIKSTV